ncbi:MAG: ribonuclease domain-containing protein, partial [Planctomycetia bacterium]|nr:ribonuclease domain-containing protein [Planctomycetia bacterium]
SQHDSPETSCPHGNECQSCSGKFSLVRTLALLAFVLMTFALASGKLSLFPPADKSSDNEPSAQTQLPSRPSSTDNRSDSAGEKQRLPLESSTSKSDWSSSTQDKSATDTEFAPRSSNTVPPASDSVVESKLRSLAPIAHPFTERNRFANAVRAAKKITIEHKRVGAKLPDNETVDLTATLERIAEGDRDHHRNDGTEFRNRERRLPNRPSYYYTEFVHRISRGSSPGACRIIIGQEGDIWYTPDHYQSFIPVSNEARDASIQQREKGRR